MTEMYSTEALERGIEQCRKNIKVFEDAIDKERDTMKRYREMIDKIEDKKKLSEAEVVIDVDSNGCDGRLE